MKTKLVPWLFTASLCLPLTAFSTLHGQDEPDGAGQAGSATPPVSEASPEVVEEVVIEEPLREDEIVAGSAFYENWIEDRLSLGTRVLWYSLTDTKKGEPFEGSFLGSIYKTDEVQDNAPIYAYLNYAITKYFGVGISYDQFKIKTLDNGAGDGTFDINGPITYLFAQYPNDSFVTPFAEIGAAFYSVSFDARDEWTYGGGDGTTVRRRFDPDNTVGFALGGGLDFEIYKGLTANLYVRYVSMDFDVNYYFSPYSTTTPQEKGNFVGDQVAYGLGIGYRF